MAIVLNIFIYLVLCWLIGLGGSNRKLGTWGYFFASVLLTPLVGAILVLASDVRRTNRKPRP